MKLLGSIVAGVVAAGSALAQAPPADHGPGHATSPADTALMDSMKGMSDGMNAAAMTGDPDGDFVRMMLAHHKGAVAMARVQLRYGRDPAMKALARQVIADQEKEITQMDAWLKAHPNR